MQGTHWRFRRRCRDRHARNASTTCSTAGEVLVPRSGDKGVLVEITASPRNRQDVAEAAGRDRQVGGLSDRRPGLCCDELPLLRLRALLARAHGDAKAYADLRDRYRDMAKTLGFEGHIAWAEAMP